MRDGWERRNLGDVCGVIAGQSPDGRSYNATGEGMPFYQGKKDFGVRDIGSPTAWTTQPTKVAQEGDILMSVRAPVGPVNLAVAEACIGRGLAAIRPRSDLDRDFLFYQLLHLKPDIAGTQGAVFPSISKTAIEALAIAYAPLPEQLRIVDILDEAFEGIAAAKANAEKNLQNARAVFGSHLQSVFTRRGEGWEDRRLGDICQVKTGRKDVNQGNPEGAYPFFTCAASHTYSDTFSFDTEALLVAGNGNVGQVSYCSGKFEVYQRTYVLFDFEGVTAKYLFRVLDKRLSETVSKQRLGNTMPYIKIRMLTDFPVPVPPAQEQKRIAGELSEVADEVERLASIYQRKLAALEELKKSLLHRAFTGQLGTVAA